MNLRNNGPSEQRTFGTSNLRNNGPSEQWTFGKASGPRNTHLLRGIALLTTQLVSSVQGWPTAHRVSIYVYLCQLYIYVYACLSNTDEVGQ